MSETISSADPHERHRVAVDDSELAYVDTGAGQPVVFLHGNPTSSYLWRNILPHVSGVARCLAPDLIGMGESGTSPGGRYRFVDHRRYLDSWFDALGLDRNVVLVGHDWGSALAFHWAQRHPDRVRGLVYMEAIVRPRTWAEFPEAGRAEFQAMRSPAGEKMILEDNWFVEERLPSGVMRALSDEEMAVYRRPYLEPGESRRPTLTWPRELPIDGYPADVVAIVGAYGEWLPTTDLPKLFIRADPGRIIAGPLVEHCRRFPHQEEVTVQGLHFVQEDAPRQIGEAIAAFVSGIGT